MEQSDARQLLSLTEEQLLAQCDLHTYKSSGTGGQHRNKVSSAVRLRHRETGMTAHGDDSRSQHQNKALAVKRLRMNIAVRLRSPISEEGPLLPPVVKQCMFIARGGNAKGSQRLEVGTKDHRFWEVAAFVLDVLEASKGQLAQTGHYIGITTGNLSSFLASERHLFTAAQEIRKAHGQKPLN